MKRILLNSAIFLILFINFCSAEWTDISTSKIRENLYSASFISMDSGYVVGWGSSGGVILYTTDAGTTWSDTTITGFYPFTVNYINPDLVIIGGFTAKCNCGAIIFKHTSDTDWQRILFDDVEYPFNFSIMDIKSNNGTNYAIGYNGSVYKSVNSALNWTKMTAPQNFILKSLIIVDDTLAYCLGGKDLYNLTVLLRSTNSGNNWDSLYDFTSDIINLQTIFNLPTGELLLFGDKISKRMIMKFDPVSKYKQEIYSSQIISSVLGGYYNSSTSGIAVCNDGTVLRTLDSGLTWNEEAFKQNVELTYFNHRLDSFVPSGIAVGLNGRILKYQSPTYLESNNSETGIKIIRSGEQIIIDFIEKSSNSTPKLLIYDLLGRNINIEINYENNRFSFNSNSLQKKNVYFLQFSGISKSFFSCLVNY